MSRYINELNGKSGFKSISDASGATRIFNKKLEDEFCEKQNYGVDRPITEEQKKILMDLLAQVKYESEQGNEISWTVALNAYKEYRDKLNSISKEDVQQANATLAYIRAAIAICQTSNELAVEIHVAGLPPIGVSDNATIIKNLRHEEQEVIKFLKGEPNTYE